MTNERALSPLQVLAIPFVAVAAFLFWLDEKMFGKDESNAIMGIARRRIEVGEYVTSDDVDLEVKAR